MSNKQDLCGIFFQIIKEDDEWICCDIYYVQSGTKESVLDWIKNGLWLQMQHHCTYMPNVSLKFGKGIILPSSLRA